MATPAREDKRNLIEGLVAEHETYVRGLAVRLAPNPAGADDIAQEAFLIAFRKIDSIDTSYDVRPYLATIVRNLSRKAWDAAIRANRLKRDALAAYVERLSEDSTSLYEPSSKTALRACLENLPPRSHTLLQLRYHLDLHSKQIAGQIDSSAAAVRMALVRIRQQLKVCIEQASRQSPA